MSADDDRIDRPDGRERPSDPAGTRPKVDPESLLPARREPLISEAAIDSTAIDDEQDPDLLPQRVAAAEPPGSLRARDEAPHAPRFQFLFGALVTLAIAALATVVVIAASGPESNVGGPTWSPWRPSKDGASAPEQIAQHIGREYKLAGGEQLVLVTGGPLEVAGLQLTIALRRSAAEGGDISLVDGKGVLYRLCGLGPKCSIDRGKPSAARKLLLHREALELALYTFRYTDADHVVVLVPPPRGKVPSKTPDPNEALFFRRNDVNPELNRPVTATLTPTTPLPSSFRRSPDAGLVTRLTGPRVFEFSVTPGNLENHAYLVLQRFASAG